MAGGSEKCSWKEEREERERKKRGRVVLKRQLV
jgi:hypothetical protein